MPRTRIKICCIASVEEARLAASVGADLLGLVGPMPTGPGVLDLPAARDLADQGPPWARPVLLTASETAEGIQADAAAAGVDAVQIVRHIAPEETAAVQAAGLLTLQVIHVEGPEAVDIALGYQADALLLDSGRPSEQALGGTGQTHDWAVSAEIVQRATCPVFLAGGLNPNNIGAAIAQVRPFGVDICSGIRREGRLNQALLEAFVAAVQEAA